MQLSYSTTKYGIGMISFTPVQSPIVHRYIPCVWPLLLAPIIQWLGYLVVAPSIQWNANKSEETWVRFSMRAFIFHLLTQNWKSAAASVIQLFEFSFAKSKLFHFNLVFEHFHLFRNNSCNLVPESSVIIFIRSPKVRSYSKQITPIN